MRRCNWSIHRWEPGFICFGIFYVVWYPSLQFELNMSLFWFSTISEKVIGRPFYFGHCGSSIGVFASIHLNNSFLHPKLPSTQIWAQYSTLLVLLLVVSFGPYELSRYDTILLPGNCEIYFWSVDDCTRKQQPCPGESVPQLLHRVSLHTKGASEPIKYSGSHAESFTHHQMISTWLDIMQSFIE